MRIPLLENIKAYIVDPVILLLFGLALLIFLYGLVRFLWQGDTVKNAKEGQDKIIWGLIGMAIMVSVYGFLHIIASTINQLMTGV
ncbi:MAG: hypothetical protein WC385_00735 [Candidatus Paceibacterota bacterium]|jgi:hypothetical protein